MAARTTRHHILALQNLPAHATVDDAIESHVFLAKIDAGLVTSRTSRPATLNLSCGG
jgi:hypothetical protein